jgi:hypothetical protein
MTPHDDQLRHAFRTYAANLSDEHTPPPASAVLFRAERRRRRLAIERAERPLLIMQITGLICAVCAVAWLTYRFAPFHQLPTIGTTYLVLALACMLLILAGCSAMLLASRRPSSQ